MGKKYVYSQGKWNLIAFIHMKYIKKDKNMHFFIEHNN